MANVTERTLGPIKSPLLGIACLAIALAAVGYVRLLDQQGSLPGIDGRVAFVLALLISLAILSGFGALATSATVRAVTAAACVGCLLPLGVLAMFSIGMLLLVAAGIALFAWFVAFRDAPDQRTVTRSVVAAIASLVVLVVGFVATA